MAYFFQWDAEKEMAPIEPSLALNFGTRIFRHFHRALIAHDPSISKLACHAISKQVHGTDRRVHYHNLIVILANMGHPVASANPQNPSHIFWWRDLPLTMTLALSTTLYMLLAAKAVTPLNQYSSSPIDCP